MNESVLERQSFEEQGQQFEVRIIRDEIAQGFRIAVFKNGNRLEYKVAQDEWVEFAYSVTFETEMDARTVMERSAVKELVEIAKSDVTRLPYREGKAVS